MSEEEAAVGDGAVAVAVVGRSEQVLALKRYMGYPQQQCYGSIFLYGTASTGKSHVVQSVMKASGVQHCIVDCLEAYSLRVLFEQILNTLSGVHPSAENMFQGYGRCDTMAKFIPMLKKVYDSKQGGGSTETTYIVLDHVERLRRFKPQELAGLLRIQELAKRNIGLVMLSSVVWENICHSGGVPEPHLVHFPTYTRTEAITIIMQRKSRLFPAYSDNLFRSCASLIWDVYHGSCRDISELMHLTLLFFDKYRAPVISGEVKATNHALLFKRIEASLRDHLCKVYLRETSTSEWRESIETEYKERGIARTPGHAAAGNHHSSSSNSSNSSNSSDPTITRDEESTVPGEKRGEEEEKEEGAGKGRAAIASDHRSTTASNPQKRAKVTDWGRTRGGRNGGASHETPYYAKVLLIAAFLASRNKQRSDLALFSLSQTRRTRRSKRSKGTGAASNRGGILEPQTFSLSRLFAIFYSLLDAAEDVSADIYTHITSLVERNLLARVTPMENFDEPKFKCLLSLEEALVLGTSTDINIAMLIDEDI